MQFASQTFWKGTRDSIPFVLVVTPFGTLYGVLAADTGLSPFEAVSFSAIALGGTAQITALSLMEENAPILLVMFVALAVNLRMAMYSAAMAPHIGALPFKERVFAAYMMLDQSFALSDLQFTRTNDWTVVQKFSYFAGTNAMIAPLWIIFSLVGALIGQAMPDWLALDFAIPICFIALVAPALGSLPHVVGATASAVFAIVFAFLPFGLGLILAAIIAIALAAETERRMAVR